METVTCDFNCCRILCYIDFILLRISNHGRPTKIYSHKSKRISVQFIWPMVFVHALTFKCRFYALNSKQLIAPRGL